MKSITLQAKKTFALFLLLIVSGNAYSQSIIDMNFIGRYSTGIYDKGATEISAYDHLNARLFSVNGFSGDIEMISLTDPANPVLTGTIDMASYGIGVNSVDFHNGVLAAAVEAYVKQDSGRAVFFNTNGTFLKQVVIGALPDMITFTPDGSKVLVANEGEPSGNYENDPNGTVSIIDLSAGIGALTQGMVTTLDFSAYNGTTIPGVRVYGKNASFSQDMEPEYIAVSADSKTAWVTLQENNAIAGVNLLTKSISWVKSLGVKNYNLPGNAIDASDRNSGIIEIANWPVFGMYQPDAIAAFKTNGLEYTILANEGDVREYDSLNEAKRVSALTLDPVVFPNADTLKHDTAIGRLNVTSKNGDIDQDGDYDELYSFGSRSYSIRSANGDLIYDSGDFLEQFTSSVFTANFNASNTNNNLKNRSDDKGPEAEGVTVANILDSVFAFIGLERMGGILVMNITNPSSPQFADYINTRNLSQIPAANMGGDLGPEGLLFVPADESPNGKNLLVVSNEISGTISIYETDVTCGSQKVLVCHNGVTLCVNKNALPAFLALGATLGECAPLRLADAASSNQITHGSFPNPASSTFHVMIQELMQSVYVSIYSADGRLVNEKFVDVHAGSNQRVEFDIKSLPPGFYYYSITSEDVNYGQGKFVISR